MKTEIKKVSDLSYVGNRDYIRGVDLLKFFFKFYDLNKSMLISRFSINKPISKNGIWFSSKEKPERYSAHLNLFNGNENTSYWFLENADKIIRKDKDVPSLILNIETKKTLCGNFKFTKLLSGNSFLDALVEANKKLHALEEQKIENGRPKIQLVYFENIYGLNIKHSDIKITNLSIREVKDTIYTLSNINSSNLSNPIRICFSYLKK
tara:strand:- start:1605 stop:2228 length:624 start_codon:yes stop_codon:yes gene_type:complete